MTSAVYTMRLLRSCPQRKARAPGTTRRLTSKSAPIQRVGLCASSPFKGLFLSSQRRRQSRDRLAVIPAWERKNVWNAARVQSSMWNKTLRLEEVETADRSGNARRGEHSQNISPSIQCQPSACVSFQEMPSAKGESREIIPNKNTWRASPFVIVLIRRPRRRNSLLIKEYYAHAKGDSCLLNITSYVWTQTKDVYAASDVE